MRRAPDAMIRRLHRVDPKYADIRECLAPTPVVNNDDIIAMANRDSSRRVEPSYAEIRQWLVSTTMTAKQEIHTTTVVDLVSKQSFEIDLTDSETIEQLKHSLEQELCVGTVRLFFEHSKSPYTKMNSKVLSIFKDHTIDETQH